MPKIRNMTKKELGLLKGAIRRVYSRSEIRQKVIERTRVYGYSDPNRPRVKKWSKCEKCLNMTPTYTISVDHIDPVIRVDETWEELSSDIFLQRMWDDIDKLQGICDTCHDAKTKVEREQRTKNKRSKKNASRK